MKTKFSGILTLFLALVVQLTFAQEKTISGTVTDQSGLPLPGVNIVIKGTSTGTQTDFDGNYNIKANKGAVLVYSYIGFAKKEVVIADNNSINIQLEEDAAQLEEVVVTGVATGTIRKRLATVVESVSGDDLVQVPVESIDEALQGKVAGGIIQATTGQPGQQQSIILRAINSLNSTQPMVLIDGVEILTSSNFNGSAGNQSSRLTDIDFSNIERVEVVSGAAAATVYGAQGANGVINIITKKGSIGKPKVTLSTSTSFADAILENKNILAQTHRLVTDSEGFIVDSNGDRLTPDPITGQYNAPVEDFGAFNAIAKPYQENTYNRIDELFKTARTNSYGVSVSGGTESIRYLLSGNRDVQTSPITPGDLARNNFRANIGADINDKLSFNNRIDFTTSLNTTGTVTGSNSTFSPLLQAFLTRPYIDLDNLNANGDLVSQPDAGDANGYNWKYFQDVTEYEAELTRIIENFNVTYNPFKVLSLSFTYGFDTYNNVFNRFIQNQSNNLLPGVQPRTGELFERTTKETQQNALLRANLNIDFNEDLKLGIPLQSNTSVIFDWRDRQLNLTDLTGTNLPEGSYGSFNINQAGTKELTQAYEETFRTYGFLVNQSFNYGDYAGISAGFRTDYSSAFGRGSEPFTFPRGDIFINVSEFISPGTRNLFKLRAAYGEAGVQPDPLDRINTLVQSTVGNENITALRATLQNEDLDVETTQELEFGIDFKLYNQSGKGWMNSLSGGLTYFDRKTDGVIYDIETPPSSGAGSIITNGYDTEADGFQATLNFNVFKSDKFNWDLDVNFLKSEARLASTETGLSLTIADRFVLEPGQEIGTFTGFVPLTSIDQTDPEGNRYIAEADADNYVISSTGYVVDRNTQIVQHSTDKKVIGNALPDFTFAFINSFSFGNFLNLSVQVDWFKGMDVYNRSKQWLYRDNTHSDFDTPLTIDGETAPFWNYYNSLYLVNEPSGYFVEDGSFVRLRNVSVTLKLKELAKIEKLDFINLTLSGRNLVTWTKYSGFDPEATASGDNVEGSFARGLDEFSFPNLRSYNIGLKVGF